ncbi:hypothetical protein OC610_05935 [Pseudomonas sp. SAICEU22]|uniref:Ig-like domain (Group 3) n=1 Tax=Pseudomonas agronomica TaxID=2979328 RepID=A0ABT3F4B6_9PSED|nr:hypothetical protein [Pseudomonas agronomica]MCW1243938.1 hypothetical protein [Pseudomonas agronomica]
MSTDDFEPSKSEDASPSVSAADAQVGEAADKNGSSLPAGLTGQIFIQAMGSTGSPWANFMADYAWSPDGGTFRLTQPNYSAQNNGSSKGNVYIQLVSAADTGYVELTNDDAIQDGAWHPLNRTAQVSGNSNSVNVKFKYTYDRSGDDPHIYGERAILFDVPVPTVNPIKNVSDRTVRISGTGAVSGGQVFVHTSIVAEHYRASMQANGSWSVNAPLSDGARHLTFIAYQTVGGRQSSSTPSADIYLAYITQPPSGAVLVTGETFRGLGAPGSKVTLVKPSNHNDRLTDEATVEAGTDQWQSALKDISSLPSGPLPVLAIYDFLGFPRVLSATVTYNVLGAPAIASPEPSSRQPVTFTLTGNNGLEGSDIEVYLDLTSTRVGTGRVPNNNGQWSAQVTVEPGARTLTVLQKKSGKTSARGASRLFKVAPNPPTLLFRTGEVGEFYGSGFPGAEVIVHVTNGALVLRATVQSSGAWVQAIPTTFMPGNYSFDAKQSVSDGGSGRIESNWGTRLTNINVATPKPTGLQVTLNGQRPTFSGQGRNWDSASTQVRFYNNRALLDDVPYASVTNASWQTTSNGDFAPGRYPSLTARQVVNSTWSEDAPFLELTVPSPTPVFTQPPAQTGQRPQISGTAWPASTLVVKISDREDERLTATGGTFTLNATADWAPRTYTIEARATFGEQTSPPATRSFTVKTPVPRFTTSAGDAVDLTPVIEGEGWSGCWIVIYSTSSNQPLGSGPVGGNGKFAISLVPQTPGNLDIYAKQAEEQDSTNVSDQTATLGVNVRVAVPQIQVPPANGRPPRISTFSGVGTTGGFVELYIKGQELPLVENIPVVGGVWSAQVVLPAGARTLEVLLRHGTYPSAKGEHVVTVVPNVPLIDTPLPDEALGNPLFMSGFGFAGDTIRIDTLGGTRLGSVTVSPSGTWTARIDHDMSGDAFEVSASAGAGLDSQPSSPLSVALLLKDLPQFTEPQPGDWVGVRPQYSGLATPGASISIASWFDTEQRVAPPTVADAHGRWEVMGNSDLAEGQGWVTVRQTVGGVESQWVDSGRFMVEKMPAGFEPPTVDFPQLGQEVGRYPMFSGRGVPGSRIYICEEGKYEPPLIPDCWVGRDGRWATQSIIELPIGDNYRYSTRQYRDGAASPWLVPNRDIKVIQVQADFAAAVIHTPAQGATVERRPLFSGAGTPGALLDVFSRSADDLYRQYGVTQVDAQGQWSMRCEEQLDPRLHAISCVQKLDGADSAKPETVNFTVVDRIDVPVLVSPVDGGFVSPRAVIRGTALPGAVIEVVNRGQPSVGWGTAVVDEQGRWAIVTRPLPLGTNNLAMRANKDGSSSLWVDFTVQALDLG